MTDEEDRSLKAGRLIWDCWLAGSTLAQLPAELPATACHCLQLPVTTYYYLQLPTTTYYLMLPITAYDYLLRPTTT